MKFRPKLSTVISLRGEINGNRKIQNHLFIMMKDLGKISIVGSGKGEETI